MVDDLQLFPALDPATEAAMRASIDRFGVLVPIVVDQHGRVLDGHHRRRIAGELGRPCPRVEVTVTNDVEAEDIARTLNLDRRHLDVEQLRQVAADLRANGHSVRAIASATGATIGRVQRALSGVSGDTPDRIRGRRP